MGDMPDAPLDEVVSHFDSVAEVYDGVLPFFSTIAAQATEVLDLGRFARVLDLAAGRGALAREALARGCASVWAVDGSPRMVELLARDLPDATARVTDAQRLDLPDASFDAVVAGFVVHIVAEPERLVGEAARVVAPGGVVALVVPGRADGEPDPWSDPVQDVVREFRRFHPDGSGRHAGGDYASEEALLVDAGLTDVASATLEVALPVRDGATYWDWMQSHGAGTFARRLSDGVREEFRRRVIEAAESGDLVLRRSAAVWWGFRATSQ